MLIDYKFWYINRYNAQDVLDGLCRPQDVDCIFEAALRFFTGDITTQNEIEKATGNLIPVTRYRRSQRIGATVLQKLGLAVKFDANNNPALVLTPAQFGVIKTDAELAAYCNQKLAALSNFANASPITQQT